MSRRTSGALAAAVILLTALPLEAQRIQAHLEGGPTWRSTAGGAYGAGFDAMSVVGGIGTALGPRLAFQLEGGFTVGSSSEAIPIGAPCDPLGFCPGGNRTGVVVPGSLVQGRAGLAWTLPGAGDRFELHGGAGVYAASVSGPDAVFGLNAGISAALFSWLDLGLEATRLTSDLGTLRWLVTPALRLRLR